MSHMEERAGEYRYVNSEFCKGLPFCIDMAGVDRCTSHYYLQRKNASISVMGYTYKGTGIIIQNGKKVEAGPGSLFLVNAGDSHEYYAVRDWEFYWVNIQGAYWKDILMQYGLEEEIVFCDFEPGQEFVNWIRNITNDAMDLYEWQIGIQGFLYEIVLYLYKTRNFTGRQTIGTKLKNELEKNMSSNITQEDICKRLGLSARHAQRIFKQEYGMSMHQFLTEQKLRKAKALLMNTTSSVKQIGTEVGFENEKYFSTFFHSREGMSPTQYRAYYRTKSENS